MILDGMRFPDGLWYAPSTACGCVKEIDGASDLRVDRLRRGFIW